jgi:hypothetical protein
VCLTARDEIADEVRRHARNANEGKRDTMQGVPVAKISSLICGIDTLQCGSISRRKYSRQGDCKSRGRTFIAGQGFLFCAPVNGVDYKSPKKNP